MAGASAPASGRLPPPPSRGRATAQALGTFWRVLRSNPLSLLGFLMVAFLGIVAVVVLVAPGLVPYGPVQLTTDYHQSPSWKHPFGTDTLGLDLYSEVLRALPIDLGIGVAIAGISLILGGGLGLAAGFWDKPGTPGGVLSVAILRFTDIFLSFPSLILALAITASLGPGLYQVILAITATWWPYYVRLVRGEVLAVKHLPYVVAARASGVREGRILFRHVLRNVLDPIVVYFTMDIGTVLVTFSTIAFVAKGIPYPGSVPEWGSMIAYYQDYLLQYPWTVLAPGAAVFVTVIAFSLLGDGLRDILDPRSRRAFVRGPTIATPSEPAPAATPATAAGVPAEVA